MTRKPQVTTTILRTLTLNELRQADHDASRLSEDKARRNVQRRIQAETEYRLNYLAYARSMD